MGGVEIVCGLLLLLGLLTRLGAIVLLINISVAIATTKIPILVKSTLAARTTARLVHEYELAEWRPVH